jgi:TrmH family RNA methyltransferase
MDHITIVLVRPQQPGNIGLAARALANHGITKLVLVQPQGFDADRARWMAPKAHHIINNARFCSSIQEAVKGAVRVVATSARPRRWDRPVWAPQEAASQAIEERVPTAFVFGPEDAGLSTEDLMACHGIMSFPTVEVRSLNLGQAVTVTCAHLQAAQLAQTPTPTEPEEAAAPAELSETVIQEAVQVLDGAGYLRGRSAVQVHGTLYRLMGRARPSLAEAAILRGMTKQLLWWFKARSQ